MTVYLSNRDGNGKTNEEGHYRLLSKILNGQVLGSTDLQVVENTSLNMSVLVKSGDYRLETSGYAYNGWIDTDTNVVISAADPSNPRITVVVIYVDKSMAGSPTPPNNPGIAKLMAVNGTPASTPIIPSGAAIQTAVGAGNPYMILATIEVGSGVTTISNSNITDERTGITLSDAILSPSSLTALVGPLLMPVGFIYANATSNVNPGITLGFGTWTPFAQGRTLVGIDTGDTDFGTSGNTGGAKTVTLSEAQMPAHSHSGTTSANGSHAHDYYGPPNQIIKKIYNNSDAAHGFNDGGIWRTTNAVGNHTHTLTTTVKGNSQSHNNLQPYVVVYYWRRIA